MTYFWQSILPHHLLSNIAGVLAKSEQPQLKNWLISSFIQRFSVDMSEAAETNINNYKSFNEFFIRRLKPDARPINQNPTSIVSPADGVIAELGQIKQNKLIQAKQHDFTLQDLLGGNTTLANTFQDGHFATIYLAPHNYHRVHVPYDGKLIATYFIPGRLFSVNIQSANSIPSLYSRNERLICLFESEQLGQFAVILVGAMIVGSMQLVFQDHPIRSTELLSTHYDQPLSFKKGDELGHFKVGSTVILLFAKNKVTLDDTLHAGSAMKLGIKLATIR